MASSRISPPVQSFSGSVGLSKSQIGQFYEDGYLLVPDFIPKSTCTSLLHTTRTMLRDFSLDDHPMTKFTTGPDDHVSNDYFLTSNDKIRYFFEPTAFDSTTGALCKPKEHAINKIGHFLHELSEPFANISQRGEVGARNAAIAASLGFHDPRILQSMVICKQPEIGAEVGPHQDSTFLYTRPPSAVGWWIALEDATRENGCLSFAKGSHRREPVRKRFIKKADSSGTDFVDVDVRREEEAWPRGGGPSIESHDRNGNDSGNEKYTLGEVKAGTLVLIHGNLLHKSEQNLSAKSRFIYTFHIIEGSDARDQLGRGWQYDKQNWLQPPEGGEFTRLKVES